MTNDTILVLGDPPKAQRTALEKGLAGVNVIAGNSIEVFEPVAVSAKVVFNWSGSLALSRAVLQLCPNLCWVHSRAAGLERTLCPEIVESSVPLTNGTGVFSSSLGEFVLAAILYFAKDFRRMTRSQEAGRWEPFDVMPISGQTVGIIGYGDIGWAIAERVRPLGMTVLAVKRHPSTLRGAGRIDQIYSPERRIEMLSCCDYVVVAAPLTSETRGMIGKSEFASMKPSAVVINVGRGPVIDEPALISALAEGQIKGAALDVFDQEPLPDGHAFYKLENVLLSPHCADHTPDWHDQAVHFFIAQYERFQKGQELLNVVDKELGY